MIQYSYLNSANTIGLNLKNLIVDFIENNLSSQNVKRENISMAIDHAVGGFINNGGMVVTAYDGDQLIGALILCKSGMKGFLPENIITYLAISEPYRKQGIASKLIQMSKQMNPGNFAVHLSTTDKETMDVLKKLGFEKTITEMRFY